MFVLYLCVVGVSMRWCSMLYFCNLFGVVKIVIVCVCEVLCGVVMVVFECCLCLFVCLLLCVVVLCVICVSCVSVRCGVCLCVCCCLLLC